MRRQLARLGRVATLTPAERADLARAQWALMVARLQLRIRPTGTLVRRQGGGGGLGSDGHAVDGATPPRGDAGTAAIDPAARADRVRALDLAVRRAAAHGPVRTTCLVRATALQRLLEREGIRHSRLCVGVRRTDGRFAAHAWVELGDLVLGDLPQHVRTFTPTDLRLVRR